MEEYPKRAYFCGAETGGHARQKYNDERMQAHVARTLGAYRPPTGDQAPRYAAITTAAHGFATLLIDLCPPSAELTLALRHVEGARMRANQAIAVNEEPQTRKRSCGQ